MDVLSDKWLTRMIGLAREVGNWSKDQSTKVGAVITTPEGRPISWGFNGFPMGVNDDVPERHERPLKYKWVAHAEKNCIDLSMTADMTGFVMFVTLSPCSICAQSIIQKKLATVVIDYDGAEDRIPERWREDMDNAQVMLKEAGVNVIVHRV